LTGRELARLRPGLRRFAGAISVHDALAMIDDDEDLKTRVFRLTFTRLQADAAAFGAGAAARHFHSHDELERTRRAIEHECAITEADTLLAEYLQTDWLDQFAPRPM
jgi:hypothetical protein